MNQHKAMNALSQLVSELGYPKTKRVLEFLSVIWLDKVRPHMSTPDYDMYMTPIDRVAVRISDSGLWKVFSDTFKVEMTDSTVRTLITKEN